MTDDPTRRSITRPSDRAADTPKHAGATVRRRLGRAAGAAAMALAIGGIVPAQAQTGRAPAASPADGWPDRPVRIVVPYAAGQGADVLMRIVAADLTRTLGQSIVIENRAGAGGNIGTAAVAKAAADGYTFGLGTNATHAANEFLYANTGYGAADFDAVAMIGLLPMVISTSLPDLPENGLKALIERARAKPDSLNVGLPSTTATVVFAQFVQSANAPLFGVRYKSSAQSMTDVMGGQIPLVIDTVTATRPQLASGRIRPLAITSASASDMLPGVRSVAEQGVAGFEVVAWDAVFAPRGTPAAIVAKLADHVRQSVESAETRRKLLDSGVEPKFMGPADLQRYVAAERPKWGGIIKAAGIRID